MLLNNYYILKQSLQSIKGLYYEYGKDNYEINFSIDNIMRLKLTTGNTIGQVVSDGTRIYSSYNSNFGYSTINSDPYFTNGDLAGKKCLHLASGNSNTDCFLESPTSTSWNTRTCYTYNKQQSARDFSPHFIYYLNSEQYTTARLKDIIRVATGIQNDSTPVSLSDYTLTNMINLNDVTIDCIANSNSNMIITLTNTTNSEQTIREIGIFDCTMRCSCLVDDYNNSTYVDITALTQEQTNLLTTSLADVTSWNLTVDPYASSGTTSNCFRIIVPILKSKTKLTTPIVLQPNESKTITYEIKWR